MTLDELRRDFNIDRRRMERGMLNGYPIDNVDEFRQSAKRLIEGQQQRIDELTAALKPFAAACEWLQLHKGGVMERRITSVTGITTDDFTRAYTLLHPDTDTHQEQT